MGSEPSQTSRCDGSEAWNLARSNGGLSKLGLSQFGTLGQDPAPLPQ